MQDIGKLMLLMGALVMIIGAVIYLVGRVPGIGRLPGDITIQTGGISCFFPIATSILLSIVLTIVLNLLFRVFNR